MEIIISCICSVIISIFIGNVVGVYYIKHNDEKWQEIFDEVTKVTIDEVKKLKK